MVYFCSHHPTEREAREAAQDILAQYPPRGYDTIVRVWQKTLTGEWVVEGSRGHSCD